MECRLRLSFPVQPRVHNLYYTWRMLVFRTDRQIVLRLELMFARARWLLSQLYDVPGFKRAAGHRGPDRVTRDGILSERPFQDLQLSALGNPLQPALPRHRFYGAAGREIVTSSPEGTRLRQATVPRQASTQLFTMARPRPEPPESRLREDSGR